MRLLRTDGDRPFLETHNDERNVPPYAILSHTWMSDEDEVTFNDLQNLDKARLKAGWNKLDYARRQARADGLDYLWQDTCCIDKSSSAELTEAINSMWRWYAKSSRCYAYLADMPDAAETTSELVLLQPACETAGPMYLSTTLSDAKTMIDETKQSVLDSDALKRCRWFTRGWTLQEMLAPKQLYFFSKRWTPVGGLRELAHIIAAITGVNVGVLRRRMRVSDYSVAQRMSWAGMRNCTRVEDIAYSLMGIFGVNMPIIYGEGPKAFRRLQEEIARAQADHSLYVWEWLSEEEMFSRRTDFDCLFAPTPRHFTKFSDVVPIADDNVCEVTNRGIRIELVLLNVGVSQRQSPRYKHAKAWGSRQAFLNCRFNNDCSKSIALNLNSIDGRTNEYAVRPRPQRIELIDSYHTPAHAIPTAVTILHGYELLPSWRYGWSTTPEHVPVFVRRGNETLESRLKIISASPSNHWDAERSMFRLPIQNESVLHVGVLLELCGETQIHLHLLIERRTGARFGTMYFSSLPADIDSLQPKRAATFFGMPSKRKAALSDRIKQITYAQKGTVLMAQFYTRRFVGEEVFVAALSTGRAIRNLGALVRKHLPPEPRTLHCAIRYHES